MYGRGDAAMIDHISVMIQRATEWQKLNNEKRAFILMDTPYRLKKTIDEINAISNK